MHNKRHLLYLSFLSLILFSCNRNSKVDASEASTLNKVSVNKKNDIVENVPEEITIGNQTWKTQNSTITTFANGDPIPLISNANDWFLAGENMQPAICYYNNDSSTTKEYGVIYNFYAISDPRGIAGDGWKIPDVNDINQLNQFLDKNLLSEIAMIENKKSQGIDTEERWNEINKKYNNYCPVNMYPELKYFIPEKYVSRDWKGKFEIYDSNDYRFNGFWTSSTIERDIFNIIHNFGLYFNANECWNFKYSTFNEEISGRSNTLETKETDFNHRGFSLRFLKK
jgi:uncharacterized protein (TIGR02145 family)